MEEDSRLALWMMPDGRLRDHLAMIIQAFSAQINTPRFEPHLTVCSGAQLDRVETGEALEQLAARLAPIEIKLVGLDFMAEYFCCLFIRVVPSATLSAVHELAAKIMHREVEDYLPHISLIYGDIVEDEKHRLIAELDTDFVHPFRAETLYLYSVTGRPEDWYCLDRYPLLGQETLSR